jgi:uncharacterized membrane protein YqaE (UPF0057 family)
MDLSGVTQQLITMLQGLAVPFTIIGVMSFILGFFVAPLLGDVLGNSRNYIQKALLGVAFFGFIPGIVAALYALGAAGG